MLSKTSAAAAALLLVALIAGCGGSDNGTGSRSQAALPASDFPAANGRSLEQVLLSASKGQQGPVVAPAAAMFYVGTNRFPFGVFTAGRDQITDAQVAIYATPGSDPKGAAVGPFPARIEDLTTKAAFRAKTTADDPSAAQVAYVSDIPLTKPGPWTFGALIKAGGSYRYSLLPTPHPVGQYPPPRVGQKAPAVHTLTVGQVSNISQIDTRVPPDDMHDDDLATVLGRKPVVLLFATPALCQSRVCGPVTDEAEQVKQEFGDRVAFIHQEVYNNNRIQDGPRPQMTAYGLQTEPWCFVIDRNGKVSTVLQGPFSVQELEAAVQKVA
ncbi:MAG TPA: hypothetical protein VLB79_00900 [Solirubrobacterales bacterium]|nr:hypothetical protein [Solirubrobacterales bacterium]